MKQRPDIEMPEPCPKCHKNRWKTLEKGKRYQCRGVRYRQGEPPLLCGYTREVK
jgi:hypothetical protein